MKRVKHNKIKNTAILYELLVRQISTDVLAGKDSQALSIIKEYFGKGSEIFKEFELYQALSTVKFKSETKAVALVEAVLTARKRLDTKKIRRAKYNVIKEIHSSYDVDAFFSSDVPNYRTYASIYKLFEDATSTEPFEPTDIVRARTTLVEHIVNGGKTLVTTRPKALIEFEKQPEDVRLLTTKILTDKFNDKYKNLNEAQKLLLREYINNVAHSLKTYVEGEIPILRNSISELSKKVSDKVVRIKLEEVAKQLDKFTIRGRDIKDEQVTALLHYYALIDELKKL